MTDDLLLAAFSRHLDDYALSASTRGLYTRAVQAVLGAIDGPQDVAGLKRYLSAAQPGWTGTVRTAWRKLHKGFPDEVCPWPDTAVMPPDEVCEAAWDLSTLVGANRLRTLKWKNTDIAKGLIEDPTQPGVGLILKPHDAEARVRSALQTTFAWANPLDANHPVFPQAPEGTALRSRRELAAVISAGEDVRRKRVQSITKGGTRAFPGEGLRTPDSPNSPKAREERRLKERERVSAARRVQEAVQTQQAKAQAPSAMDLPVAKTTTSVPPGVAAPVPVLPVATLEDNHQAIIDELFDTNRPLPPITTTANAGARSPAEARAQAELENVLLVADPVGARELAESKLGRRLSDEECALFGYPTRADEGEIAVVAGGVAEA